MTFIAKTTGIVSELTLKINFINFRSGKKPNNGFALTDGRGEPIISHNGDSTFLPMGEALQKGIIVSELTKGSVLEIGIK